MREQIERDRRDKDQLSRLGEHFARVARGDVKPANPQAPKISRMGFSPEELARIQKNRP